MRLEYSNRFIKQLKKAPKDIQKATRIRLEMFLADKFHPLLNNHALRGKYEGYRSLNISGDWRAIYKEFDEGRTYFEGLGTHSQMYK